MNVKKIIKGIVGLGAMAGAAYAAYKRVKAMARSTSVFVRSTVMTRTILSLTIMRTSSGSMTITMSLTMRALHLRRRISLLSL